MIVEEFGGWKEQREVLHRIQDVVSRSDAGGEPGLD
jgi:hypothetical protein